MAEHPRVEWGHYMDDTHTILKKAHSQSFTDHLNQVDNDIKLMMEGEVVTKVQIDHDVEMGLRAEGALPF